MAAPGGWQGRVGHPWALLRRPAGSPVRPPRAGAPWTARCSGPPS